MNPLWQKIIGVPALVIGIGFASYAFYDIFRTVCFLRRAKRVQGKIVELVGIGEPGTYIRKYSFADTNGRVWTFESKIAFGSKPYAVGDKIEVFFDEQFNMTRMNYWADLYAGAGMFAVLGGTFIFGGILGVFGLHFP